MGRSFSSKKHPRLHHEKASTDELYRYMPNTASFHKISSSSSTWGAAFPYVVVVQYSRGVKPIPLFMFEVSKLTLSFRIALLMRSSDPTRYLLLASHHTRSLWINLHGSIRGILDDEGNAFSFEQTRNSFFLPMTRSCLTNYESFGVTRP